MMDRLNASIAPAPSRPVKVVQFGEGNFLRAFVDYMIDIANEKTDFNGSVVLIKPISFGNLDRFHAQDCRYTVILRGLQEGKKVELSRLVTSVSDAVDAYSEYEKYANLAKEPDLRFVVSNTTEAGIVFDPEDQMEANPPRSFPGKLTKFLYERAEYFQYDPDKGLIMLPVELIDDNGIALKKCVKQFSDIWHLGDRFEAWLEQSCVFTSTLVDRIVTGYPRDEAQAICQSLGYEDELLDTAEPFGLWVIESPKDISKELPLPACGLPVIFTDNQKPYKQRKVRILNGAHTSFVPAAFQCGYDYVLDAMNDPMIASFMDRTLHEEVIPTLSLPKDDLVSFANEVTQRFRNPFIKHALLSICLNSVSKWRARCMPSLLEYVKLNGRLPERLTFSLAALISLYHGGALQDGKLLCMRGDEPYTLMDDSEVLKFFDENKETSLNDLVHQFVSREDFFGPDLAAIPDLESRTAYYLTEIKASNVRLVMKEHFGG